ncbi:MAG: aromatic ring-hydroxylating dioxygenase subunit alpha [Myxococcales bacterium]|nr:aromatic ring-hydroxylating dioxygenase subunit alpha [Myxococcales bacterium]
MVPDAWYAITTSRRVRTRPVALHRLGRRLVAWRDGDGRVVVHEDRCPHKGARLSDGCVDGGLLACPYHGFRFASDGRCVVVPVHPDRPVPRALQVHPLPVREAHGLVWLWHGEGEPSAELPWFPDLAWPSRRAADTTLELPLHYSRFVESNFDLYHFPFVHRSIDPGMGVAMEDFACEHDEDGAIRTSGRLVRRDGRPGASFRVDFLPPNVQRIEVARQFVGLVISTPIDDRTTWVFARFETRMAVPDWLARMISWLLAKVDAGFVQVRQDLPVLTQLTPLMADPTACVWVPADAGAARYVQWRHRRLRRAEETRAASPLRQAGS